MKRMRGGSMPTTGPDGRPDPAAMMQAESRKTKMIFAHIDAPTAKDAEKISG